ncbi:MAG: response regulator transcription factor, partial [Faecousia sp.]
ELESAYAQIEGNGQENMALCCDFLARRLSLHMDMEQRYSFEERHAELLRHHDAAWIYLWSATSAYYHALQGETDKIPAIFAKHQLSTINFLAPGKPMMELIENQVYLAQGSYAKVIGRSEGQLAVCDAMHYALVALHIRIQAASAYVLLGKHREAHSLLTQALADGSPDGFVIPFVENYRYLKPLLAQEKQDGFVQKIVELGEAAGQRKSSTDRHMIFAALTEREYEIVLLMAQHLTNREIAGKLFLSEGSVKQYINQIYSKLHIECDARSKRKRLLTLFLQKN